MCDPIHTRNAGQVLYCHLQANHELQALENAGEHVLDEPGRYRSTYRGRTALPRKLERIDGTRRLRPAPRQGRVPDKTREVALAGLHHLIACRSNVPDQPGRLQAQGSGPSRVSWLALDRAPPRRSPPRIRRAAAFVARCGSSGVTVVQRSGYMSGTIGIRCLNGELNQLEHSVPKQDRPRYRQADSDSNHHRWPKRTSVCL